MESTTMSRSRNLTFALIVIAFAQLMVVLDTTIVNVALPCRLSPPLSRRVGTTERCATCWSFRRLADPVVCARVRAPDPALSTEPEDSMSAPAPGQG